MNPYYRVLRSVCLTVSAVLLFCGQAASQSVRPSASARNAEYPPTSTSVSQAAGRLTLGALAALAAPPVQADGPRMRHTVSPRLGRTSPSNEAPAQTAATAASLRQASPRLAQTPVSPNTDVVTLAETGEVPPDTMGSVGPAQYLLAVNGRIRTIAKASGVADGVLDATLDAFFAPVSNGFGTTYPRARYDRHSGRWFVTAINLGFPNRYLLAVSDDDVLTGSTVWTYYFWNNARTAAGNPSHACAAEYPTLGIDEDALYIGANQFCGATLPTATTYDSSSVYVVKKAPLLLPSPVLDVSTFDGLSVGAGAGPFAPQGVDNFDTSTNVGYVIGVDNSLFSRLQIRRISDPAGTPSISSDLTLDVAVTAAPVPVPHPGGLAPLDALDDRLQQAVIRGSRLWTNHHIRVDVTGTGSGAGDRNGIRWYEIENLDTTPSVRQSGTLFDASASNPASYFYGSLMVSGQGHMALGATVAGATTHVNAVATGRLAGDPSGTLNGAPAVLTSNTSFEYNVGPPPDPQLWGEHSATGLDPVDDMTMWTLQQYVNGTDSFALRLVRLAAPPPAAVLSVTPNSLPPGATGAVLTVTGSSSSGSAFFDPGPGFSNRLAAAFSGSGLAVTGVAVTSATTLTLTVDAIAAARGARTLTVTNPDGQTSTLAAAVAVQNLAPSASTDAYTAIFNTPLTVTAPGVLSNDSDGNGDALSAVAVATPAHGSLTLNANGSFTYVPDSGYTGPDSWTYQASDGLASSAPVAVAITVALNTAPTISVLGPRSLVDETGGGAATGALAFAVSDPEGFPVTVTASSSNAAVVAAAGLVLGGSGVNRTIAVSTVAGSAGGTTTITLTANDGFLATSTSFDVTVVPRRGRPLTLQSLVARTAVTLTWSAPPLSVEAVTGYLLEVGFGPGTTALTLPLGTVTAFSALAPSGRYYVRVRALTSGGQSPPSDEVVVATGQAAPPLAPLALLATVQGANVSLLWRENPLGTEITQYQLHAGTAPGLSNLGVLPLAGNVTTFSANVAPGQYYVRIVAANPSGSGPASNEVLVAPGPGVCTIPAVPTGLVAVPRAGGVTLSWNAPASGAIPTGYRLDVGSMTGQYNVGSFPLSSATSVSAPAPPGTYFVRLVAVNGCGASPLSSELTFVVP